MKEERDGIDERVCHYYDAPWCPFPHIIDNLHHDDVEEDSALTDT
jgi:hypothetical protein